jgi:hypothetical protein
MSISSHKTGIALGLVGVVALSVSMASMVSYADCYRGD